jgi:hypothetical protein
LGVRRGEGWRVLRDWDLVVEFFCL